MWKERLQRPQQSAETWVDGLAEQPDSESRWGSVGRTELGLKNRLDTARGHRGDGFAHQARVRCGSCTLSWLSAVFTCFTVS